MNKPTQYMPMFVVWFMPLVFILVLASFDFGRLAGGEPDSTVRSAENQKTRRQIINRFGMEFVEIPPGRFYMGRLLRGQTEISEVERLNTQLHRVEITQPFLLGVTEVTERNEIQIGIAAGYMESVEWIVPSAETQESAAIESWNKANQLAITLSEIDLQYDYRLPTEAEWEYACRGQADAAYPKKRDVSVSQTHRPEYGVIEPVKLKPSNAFGLYDMLRNDGEYCSDWHSVDYYNRSPLKDPQGP